MMGVSGSGKSTVGKLLSDRLNCQFFEGDDFHSDSNIEKMSSGKALNDADRLPWLLKLQNLIAERTKENKSGVLACSALKEKYRQIITGQNSHNVRWIYLCGDYQTIGDRIKQRQDHFFDLKLLCSQFEILEEPKNVLTIDIDMEIEAIVNKIMQQLDF